jgi:holo-[acyl-carrier protein] synthase
LADQYLANGVLRVSTVGVGIDLVDIDRIERLIAQFGDRALDRLLFEGEREYCLSKAAPARHVAARVAAKEAAYKALSQAGADQVLWWHDMEVVLDDARVPGLVFHDRGLAVFEKLQIKSCLLSLTHSNVQAGAVVVVSK